MEKREAFFRRLNPWVMGVFAVVNLALGIYNVAKGNPYNYILAFCGLLFLPLPGWFYRLFRLRPVYQLNFILYVFVMISYTVGLIVHAYSIVPYYDKLAHMLSGTFAALLALVLFYLLKPEKRIERRDFGLASVFTFSVSMAVAGLWEISEYFLSLLAGTDPQNVLGTGVGDTMQDMIVCLIGTLLLTVSQYFYYRRGKTSFLMGVFESFYQMNFSEKGCMSGPVSDQTSSTVQNGKERSENAE